MSRFSGPGRRAGRRSGRRCGLAHFVLWLVARASWLPMLGVGALTTGCVLPIGPDFQNPPQAPNYPPSFQLFDPYQETAVSELPQDFYVLLQDPNPLDTLHVRWAIDYPPYVQSRSRLVVDEQTLLPTALRQVTYPLASCDIFKQGSEHQLVVIVSDRPFTEIGLLPGPDRYNQTEGDSPAIMAGWQVNCP
jgi:hypothetical protein